MKIQAAQRMQASASSADKDPDVDDSIEFLSDQFTDKGPAIGKVTRSFITADGPYITVKFADAQETMSWDDLRPYATRSDSDKWSIQKSKTTAFTINLKNKLGQS